MRAAIFSEHGGPEVVRIAEIDPPEPGPGEARIRVRAAGANHLDLWVRRGLPFQIPMPHIGGSDIAGEVESVGPGVPDRAIGTRVVVDPSLDYEWYSGVRRGEGLRNPEFRVIGEHTQGGFAEFVVVPANNLLRLPDAVSFEDAAAAALVTVTAYRALLTRGSLRAGERVLITGASGGVSTAAIQIARSAGATVFAVTSGQENVARVRELGAHVAIDRTAGPLGELLQEALGGERVDLALDSVGEAVWEALIKSLRPGGRLVTYGATTGPHAVTDIRRVFWNQLSILGSTMGDPGEFQSAMRLVFEGTVLPVVDRVLPLERAREAHELLERGGVFGKILLLP